MQRNFRYILLITWLIICISCRTNHVPGAYQAKNITVSEDFALLDSQIVQLYLPSKKVLDKEMKKVISISPMDMYKKKPESYLTNLLADIILEEARMDARELGLELQPDVSYMNYGGIRSYLPKGEITKEMVFVLLPFDNETIYIKLTGSELNEFLNQIANSGGESTGGVKFKITDKGAEKIMINGESIRPENDYWLVTNEYVADNNVILARITAPPERIRTGNYIRDAVIRNLERKYSSGESLRPVLDGRTAYE